MRAIKTEFGWEIADETGTLIDEPENAYKTKRACLDAIRQDEIDARQQRADERRNQALYDAACGYD